MRTFEIHVSRKIGNYWTRYGPLKNKTGYAYAELCYLVFTDCRNRGPWDLSKYRMVRREKWRKHESTHYPKMDANDIEIKEFFNIED